MGVWIEILTEQILLSICRVTPCVGVWIEILFMLYEIACKAVTPCVGVWIEMGKDFQRGRTRRTSLPAWECGLK